MKCFVVRTVYAAALVLAFLTGTQRAGAAEVTVSLFSSVQAVAPGESFELGVKFEIPEESYIYWENPGDIGSPPAVTWHLPDGFVAEPVRFPFPKERKTGGITSNILEGNKTLLTTIVTPEDLQVGGKITITADVTWETGPQKKAKDSRTLEISLNTAGKSEPVSDDAGGIDLIIAKRAMPLQAGKAKNISVKTSVSKETVEVGDSFELILDVSLQKGHHAQSNKPLSEFFVPTKVFIRKTPGLSYGDPVWPEAHIRRDRMLGKLSEFTGDFTVRVPVKVEAAEGAGKPVISGLLSYQICTDAGRCNPPEAMEWAVNGAAVKPLPMAATPKPTVESPKPVSDPTINQTPEPENTSTSAGDEKAKAGGQKVQSEQDKGLVGRLGLLGAIIAGILGGLILNIMPCVLPVISIKILSFVQQADENPRRVLHLGIAFSLGIIVSFWVLAAGIIGLSGASDTSRGWGAFFQEPAFLIGMSALMFVFALSLFGVFEIVLPGKATGKLAEATEKEGLHGAFMKGVLATLLATPCTAPMLGPAIAFALTSSKLNVAVVFTAVGLGMALPYLILTARPAWMKYLPKPGGWMVNFRQFMGFLLMGTVMWLLWTFAGLQKGDGVIWVVCFLLFLGLACWIYGKITPLWSLKGKTFGVLLSLGTVVLGYWLCFAAKFAGIPWIEYQKGYAEELSTKGYTVYVDYTARWCLTCQTNKGVVLNRYPVRTRFERDGIIAIKADYTDYDPVMGADLRKFGRDAVPLNVVYPANRPDEPIILPVILTKGIVFDALDQAGPSTNNEPL